MFYILILYKCFYKVYTYILQNDYITNPPPPFCTTVSVSDNLVSWIVWAVPGDIVYNIWDAEFCIPSKGLLF